MLFISRVVSVLLCWLLVRRYGEDFGLIACYLTLGIYRYGEDFGLIACYLTLGLLARH
jgi:hypothetical protein